MTSNELKLTFLLHDIADDRSLTARQARDSLDRLMSYHFHVNPDVDFYVSMDIKEIGYRYINGMSALRALGETPYEDKSTSARKLFYASLCKVCTEARKDFEEALTKTLEGKS